MNRFRIKSIIFNIQQHSQLNRLRKFLFIFRQHVLTCLTHCFNYYIKTYVMCSPSDHKAILAALIAFTAAIAFLSIHGICTSPPTGSQVGTQIVFHCYFGGVFNLLKDFLQILELILRLPLRKQNLLLPWQ